MVALTTAHGSVHRTRPMWHHNEDNDILLAKDERNEKHATKWLCRTWCIILAYNSMTIRRRTPFEDGKMLTTLVLLLLMFVWNTRSQFISTYWFIYLQHFPVSYSRQYAMRPIRFAQPADAPTAAFIMWKARPMHRQTHRTKCIVFHRICANRTNRPFCALNATFSGHNRMRLNG